MKPVLSQRHPVHRADEQRDVNHPVMQGRAVGVRGKSEDYGRSDSGLNKFFHEAILP